MLSPFPLIDSAIVFVCLHIALSICKFDRKQLDDKMAGKQKGRNLSFSLVSSSDNDLILRDSNISDKLDALSNTIDSKFDSKFDELDSMFAELHNEFSSS